MKNYNEINPTEYEKMYDIVPRENYMKTHWRPLIEDVIKRYCKPGSETSNAAEGRKKLKFEVLLPSKDKNVLDLGCGYGRYLGVITQATKNVTGLDISQRWLSEARKRYPNVKLVLGNASKSPFGDEVFDIVVSIGLFEYVDRKIVMKEINRILKKNGLCIISVPNKYSAFRMVGKFITRILGGKIETNEPSRREMVKLFKDNGFLLIEAKMDDGLIWLPNFMDRLCGKKIYKFIEQIFDDF